MSVVMARVDNRLVHGQVLEGWVPLLDADTILVIDRELVDDPLQRMVLEGLGRSRPEVCLVDPDRAAQLLSGKLARHKVLLLFASIRRALEAHSAGVWFERLNLGNVHPTKKSRAVTTSVYLTPDDATLLCELSRRGVELEARAVPADQSPDLGAIIRREFDDAGC